MHESEASQAQLEGEETKVGGREQQTPLADEQLQLAESIASLAAQLPSALAPHNVRMIIAQLKGMLLTLSSSMPPPVSTCQRDGSPVYSGQDENGTYRYCVYGHRW